MSDENFLGRWSRRKLAADEKPAMQEPPASERAAPAAVAASDTEEAFDLSTLPSIDSITSLTDVSVFLRKGVPLELGRAALRRAWTSDAGIRDYVGLAENAWDFNDPNAMAGFGPLDQTPEQVREMVRQAFGEIDRVSSALTAAEPAPPQYADRHELIEEQADNLSKVKPAIALDEAASSTDTEADQRRKPAEDNSEKESENGTVPETPIQIVRRTHGGAVPR
jgi:hypothetical protein